MGAALFSGFFMSVALISPAGIGGGDVKLAVLLGAFVGYIGAPAIVLAAMFLSFLSGAIIGAIPTLLSGGSRKTRVPFGPFLCLGSVTAILIGQRLVDAYSELLS
jgi:leader peptidase (prepilin peptidase)/N-methyltransferase